MAVQHSRRESSESRTVLWIAGIVGAVLLVAGVFVALMYILGDEVGMPVVLTREADGTSMSMIKNAQVLIVLDSNATTGYEWAVDQVDGAVVQFVESTYVAPDNGAVGQGGQQELLFKAIGPGTTTLHLKYWRPWEGDASVADRFEMTLRVRD